MLHENIIISFSTEFVGEEGGTEEEKQNCELKACYRLTEKIKKAFPKLRICVCGEGTSFAAMPQSGTTPKKSPLDSLYAMPMFTECREAGWYYLIRFKAGSIPYVEEEYGNLFKKESHERNWKEEGKECWYGYVEEIEYEKGHKINMLK